MALLHHTTGHDLYGEFAAAFTAQWNRHQAELSTETHARKAELGRVKAQLEKLVDAICNGAPPATIRDRMVSLEARRELLEAEVQTAQAPAPRLHPNLAILYREQVTTLAEALDGPDAAGARETVRALIEEVRLVPGDDGLRVEIRGELAAILGLASAGVGGAANANSARLGAASVSLVRQVKLVAGTGFEPVTFRL